MTTTPRSASRTSTRAGTQPSAAAPDVVTQEAAPAPRRSRSRAARVAAPVALGSLTQPGSRGAADVCAQCGSARITSLSMTLTDGTAVRFTSCHSCEHRTWRSAGGELDRATVLERTRKIV
jgi:hypothetical protein